MAFESSPSNVTEAIAHVYHELYGNVNTFIILKETILLYPRPRVSNIYLHEKFYFFKSDEISKNAFNGHLYVRTEYRKPLGSALIGGVPNSLANLVEQRSNWQFL